MNALDLAEKEIDGLNFRALKFGGRDGLRLFTKVSAQLAPLLTILQKIDKFSSEIDLSLLSTALQKFADTFKTKSDFDNFIDELVSKTEVQIAGKWVPLQHHFDDVFIGKTTTSIKVLGWIISHNYSNFLKALPAVTVK